MNLTYNIVILILLDRRLFKWDKLEQINPFLFNKIEFSIVINNY